MASAPIQAAAAFPPPKPGQLRGRLCFPLKPLGLPELGEVGLRHFTRAQGPMGAHAHEGLYELSFLAKGKLVFNSGGATYHLKGRDGLLTLPGESHDSAGTPMERCRLYWFSFRDPGSRGPFLGLDSQEQKHLSGALRHISTAPFRGGEHLKVLFDELLTLASQGVFFQKSKLRVVALRILWAVCDPFGQGEKPTHSPEILQVVRHVHQNLSERLTVGDLVEVSGLSVSRLHARFKDELGLPPLEYVLREKIEESKNLLRHTDRSIIEISTDLGFSSSQYFATTFRRFAAVSPRDFREKNQNLPGTQKVPGKPGAIAQWPRGRFV